MPRFRRKAKFGCKGLNDKGMNDEENMAPRSRPSFALLYHEEFVTQFTKLLA